MAQKAAETDKHPLGRRERANTLRGNNGAVRAPSGSWRIRNDFSRALRHPMQKASPCCDEAFRKIRIPGLRSLGREDRLAGPPPQKIPRARHPSPPSRHQSLAVLPP